MDMSERQLAEERLRESEERFRAIFDQTIAGVAETDLTGRFARVNGPYCEMVGRPADELCELRMQDITHPDDIAGNLPLFERCVTDGTPFVIEKRYMRPDGSLIWVSNSVSALRDGHGRTRSMVAVSLDITERKRAEARQAFLLKLSDALRAEPDADAVANRALQLLCEQLHLDRCCVAVYRSAGDGAELTHQVAGDGMPRLPDSVRAWHLPAASRIAIGGTNVFDDVAQAEGLSDTDRRGLHALGLGALVACTLRRSNDLPACGLVAASATPRKWTQGEIALLEDVTERTWAAMDRARAEQQLREADRRKDEFLATLAHELRNPLAPIRNALHLLRPASDRVVTPRIHEMLERQVNHMVRLLDDLLEVSRISRGAIALRRERIDLRPVVRDAVETCRPAIDRSRHVLDVVLPDEPIIVVGDELRLAQVLSNLLNNAARYTDPGGTVELTARREGMHALVDVRDTGIGIAPDQLSRVFEMFGQLDRTDMRSQGGLGIGLALAQSLAQMHGGVVEAHSEGRGHGSRFTLRLPLAAPAEAVPAEPGPSRQTPALARRVLIVDDNKDAADSAAMVLGFLGADARAAYNGPSALAVIDEWRPSVVLLDLGMPGMDGCEVARRIRADARHADLTLVALTGWGQMQDRQRTHDAGFDHHLVKPADPSALQSLIESLDSRHRTPGSPGPCPTP